MFSAISEDNARIIALRLTTENWSESIEEGYCSNLFDAEGGEYYVLTEMEADALCADQIKESLWAFNSDFLANMTDLPKEAFACQNVLCESANEPFLAMIQATCGLEAFVKATEGKAHFLASYDDEEIVQCVGPFEFYIYRTN